LSETMDQLRSLPADATPPEMAETIHRLVRTLTSNPDPYRQVKKDATDQVLALVPLLRGQVRAGLDPLDTAVRIAIAGTIIDRGVAESFSCRRR